MEQSTNTGSSPPGEVAVFLEALGKYIASYAATMSGSKTDRLEVPGQRLTVMRMAASARIRTADVRDLPRGKGFPQAFSHVPLVMAARLLDGD